MNEGPASHLNIMRFVDTTSLKFHEVSDSELDQSGGRYCILSHRWTWGEDEIQHADILSMDASVKSKGGFAKFIGACALAKVLRYDFIWIDTCCINKKDAVELGEAINSMYRWYSRATICIAYLQDVTTTDTVQESEWFSRGWTLQELIAPEGILFFGHEWQFLGSRTTLRSQIVSRTGIPADVLSKKTSPQAYSVAQRMSWAAKRTTKRLEDRAYSLMGLFNVNMPMIYGERERAFTRLQEQIITKLADESIFVWDLGQLENSTTDAKRVYCGMFASSPACFANCGDVINVGGSRGFRIDQFGLAISAPATLETLERYRVPLMVTRESHVASRCALFLSELPTQGSFARTSNSDGESTVMTKTLGVNLKEFRVPMDPGQRPSFLYHGMWLRSLRSDGGHVQAHETFPRHDGGEDRLLLPAGRTGTAGIIRLSLHDAGKFTGFGWIKLGFDPACRPVCFVTFPGLYDKAPDPMMMQAEELLALSPGGRTLLLGLETPKRINHEFFDDEWTIATKSEDLSLPHNCVDSRMQPGSPDGCLNFTCHAPLLKIDICAERVLDVSPTSSGSQEIWAVNIIVGTAPTQVNQDSHGCCSCQ